MWKKVELTGSIPVASLEGAALNWAVAKCEGLVNEDGLDVGFIIDGAFIPSTDWAQAGLIIEREGLSIELCGEKNWLATRVEDLGPAVEDITIYETFGPTPLVAAMRCYVASKLGNEVVVPNELV